ncbi:alpha,alpha-trehalase [Fodinisporobacter ferrooxydans]|uniref:Alpha,alpha-trehalase n=1 Tax=Fodinisporobacter ferrooxydans TaxID=2901836 RepID=A0ABY4CG36_9BACL|nr:alpha,alpha-trehalase [Alicyclobacillaceae bacterium MYW30-H2]
MYFDLPQIRVQCSDRTIEKTLLHIHQFWKYLIKTAPPYTKNELFYLPHSYVVPGGVFQQLFYWDSYFMILGLKISKLHSLARGIVENFLYEIKTFGIIPNSSELAHLSRSQPPFLTSMIQEVWEGDLEWLRYAYEWAKVEYENVWMDANTHFHQEIGLNRYYDRLESLLKVKGESYLYFSDTYFSERFWQERVEAESGWDYTGRFYRQCGNVIPVDLNSLLYKYETDFSYLSKILHLENEVVFWKNRASKRKKLMDQYLWNQELGMYLDYNFVTKQQYRYFSLATFYPLWASVASPQQAAKIRKHISLFLCAGGMVTSTVPSGFQWDYPNGWAPLQWIVIQGLKNYGYLEESLQIAKRWIRLCTHVFLKHGKLYEKYNVVDFNIQAVGRYPLQEGFGWTNGIYEKIAVDILGCIVQ